jgi:hypothetical protein
MVAYETARFHFLIGGVAVAQSHAANAQQAAISMIGFLSTAWAAAASSNLNDCVLAPSGGSQMPASMSAKRRKADDLCSF